MIEGADTYQPATEKKAFTAKTSSSTDLLSNMFNRLLEAHLNSVDIFAVFPNFSRDVKRLPKLTVLHGAAASTIRPLCRIAVA